MRTVLAALMLLAALAPLAPSAAAETFTVTATNFAWTPDELLVAPGDSVTFESGEGTHTWELADGSDSCELPCTRSFAEEGVVEYVCGLHASMTGTIQVGVAPEVAVATPAPGAVLEGTVRVEGDASHPASEIRNVTVLLRDVSVEATLVGSGSSVSWLADVPTQLVANGAAELVARAVAANGLSGEARVAVTVDNPPFVDLAVVALSAPSNALVSATLSFVVENRGNVPSGAFLARAEYLYEGAWHPIGDATVASIAAGAQRGASVTWTPEDVFVGQFDVRVRADPDAQLPDPDRANNERGASMGWVAKQVPGVRVDV